MRFDPSRMHAHGAMTDYTAHAVEGRAMSSSSESGVGRRPLLSDDYRRLNAELVGNEAGVLVTPGDLPALRSALTAVIESTQLRARLAEGARRVRDRLSSWEGASARLAESVERVAGKERLTDDE